MGLFDFFKKKKGPVTPDGSSIYRYQEREDADKLHLPDVERVYAQEVEDHFDALFPGRKTRVLHEIVSDFVHIDIHVMWPTADQPFYVVYTTGMSDLPMTVPPQVKEDLTRAELYLFLPGEWSLDDLNDTSVYWPIHLLKFLARFPHAYHTWLAYGHTVPNGEDYAPFDDSVGFSAVVLMGGDGPLSCLTAKDGQRVMIYGVNPCYKEEIEFKLKYGLEKLYQLFEEHKVMGMLDPQRPNLCADFKEVLD